MTRTATFQHTLPNLLPKRTSASVGLSRLRHWQAPTYGEFVRQLEHEFGDTIDVSSLSLTRADNDEALTPHSVRSLCELLGVPPEDFGV